MQNPAIPRPEVTADVAQKSRKHKLSLAERVAFSPAEFAAAFGRSETWGYRRLYDGSVKAVQMNGRLLIPRSEIDRLLDEAAIYNGHPARAPKSKRPSPLSNRQAEGDEPKA